MGNALDNIAVSKYLDGLNLGLDDFVDKTITINDADGSRQADVYDFLQAHVLIRNFKQTKNLFFKIEDFNNLEDQLEGLVASRRFEAKLAQSRFIKLLWQAAKEGNPFIPWNSEPIGVNKMMGLVFDKLEYVRAFIEYDWLVKKLEDSQSQLDRLRGDVKAAKAMIELVRTEQILSQMHVKKEKIEQQLAMKLSYLGLVVRLT
jgi:hypothetical protein